jgi:hypothetical protein
MYTYEFTGKYVGDTTVDGAHHQGPARSRSPVGCENTNATIDLVSDSYLPVFLQSATWEGEFTIKSARK